MCHFKFFSAKSVVLLYSALLLLPWACAQKPAGNFESDWQSFIRLPELKHAAVGLIITDASDGKILQSYNEEKLFLPASVQKIITTAYALETLGPDYTFETKVMYTGSIDTDRKELSGNIYIVGGGDPTLGSKFFSKVNKDIIYETKKALEKLGIKRLSGDIIASDAIYGSQRAPSTWGWQDVANYYASGAAGLSYADNQYSLFFNTDTQTDSLVQLLRQEPQVPGMRFVNEVRAYEGDSDRSYIHGSEYSDLRYIRGKLPKGKPEYEIKGAFSNPPLFLAQILKSELDSTGITVQGKAVHKRISDVPGGNDLCRIQSPALRHILRLTNHSSINLYAEHLLRQPIADKNPGAGIDEALEAMRDFWKSKGLYHEAIKYEDGAGLSPTARLTPKHLAEVLFYMKHNAKHSEIYYESLPIAGTSGTLSRFLNTSEAKGKLRLKSGSFTGIRCYAGYGTTKSGREIIMVLMVNDFTGNTYRLRNKMADVFESAYLNIK